MKSIKNILLLCLIVIAFIMGCQKKVEEPKEEYIQIYDEDGLKFYIATPSGTLYYSTGSEIQLYVDENGNTRNINDDVEVHR